MAYDKNGNWKFTLSQIRRAKENGICYNTLATRMNNLGWDIKRAINEPVSNMWHKSHFFSDEEFNIAKENGISKNLLYTRVRQMGWTKEQAINTPVHKKGEKYEKYSSKNSRFKGNKLD